MPANPVFVASGEVFFPQNLHEIPFASTPSDLEYPRGHLPDTPWGMPTTQRVPSNPPVCVPGPSTLPLQTVPVWTVSNPPPPLPQTPTFLPYNWHHIPQKIYGYGRRQWDFAQSESIYFGVNGRPGINMRDALLERFTGLDSRDELVLQDASGAVSCRFLVRLSW